MKTRQNKWNLFTATCLTSLFFVGEILFAQPYPTHAGWKNLPLSNESSFEIAEFVAGHSNFNSAQCEAIYFRPALTDPAVVTEGNRLECGLTKDDGSVEKVTRTMEQSPVGAWGSRWSEARAFTVQGPFAEELAHFMGAKTENDPHANTPRSLWSQLALCDRDFNHCTDEYALLMKRVPKSEGQVFCVRWTEAVPGSPMGPSDPITGDNYDRSLRAAIQKQIDQGHRRITHKWCTFRG